jgi:putative PIN family toxin of toxin-antitoxin system
MTTPKQVVIDTNVCLDLFVFNDPRWARLLVGLNDGSIKAFTREDCRQEWLAVLHYPHLPINDSNRGQIIITFDELISCVSPENKNLPLPRCTDKDDQKFMEIASDAGVETLITKDKALLKLARKTQQAGYFTITTPEQFLANFTARSVTA